MSRPTAMDVARYILWYTAQHGVKVTNLKLQKLLFFCQGWYLALKGEPLFVGKIQAWPKGGVHYESWREYNRWGRDPISAIPDDVNIQADVDLVNKILDEYMCVDQWILVKLSHGDAWLEARGELPPATPSRNEVRLEWMRREFMKMAAEREEIESSTEEDPELEYNGNITINGIENVSDGDLIPIIADGQNLLWQISQDDISKIAETATNLDLGSARPMSDAELFEKLNLPTGGVH